MCIISRFSQREERGGEARGVALTTPRPAFSAVSKRAWKVIKHLGTHISIHISPPELALPSKSHIISILWFAQRSVLVVSKVTFLLLICSSSLYPIVVILSSLLLLQTDSCCALPPTKTKPTATRDFTHSPFIRCMIHHGGATIFGL